MPNPEEVATLVVAGNEFHNFESVYVHHEWTKSFPEFHFTTADIVEVPGTPPPANWQKLQFKPGDDCAIYLGGQLMLVGVICMRQTSYDANNKGVMLQGIGRTWYAARASVIPPQKTNFDGMTVEQVARAVIGPTQVGAITIGKLDEIPFKQLQIQPGEPIADFIERIGRPKGLILGSDTLGNFLLIGDHNLPVVTALVEGVNILRMQATIQVEKIWSEYMSQAQSGATNEMSGTNASEKTARRPGTAKYYSPILTPMEQPVWTQAEVERHAANEQKWHQGTIITANVVVQGWMLTAQQTSGGSLGYLASGRRLWRAGENVQVVSPMAMLNMVMKIKSVTFTQDRNSGTTTMLELVAPWLLNDQGDYNLSQDQVGIQSPEQIIDNVTAADRKQFPDLPPLTLEPSKPFFIPGREPKWPWQL